MPLFVLLLAANTAAAASTAATAAELQLADCKFRAEPGATTVTTTCTLDQVASLADRVDALEAQLALLSKSVTFPPQTPPPASPPPPPKAPFAVVLTSANTCPSGYAFIDSGTDCSAARDWIAANLALSGVVNPDGVSKIGSYNGRHTASGRQRGCYIWWTPGMTVFYNEHATGAAYSAGRLICKEV